MQVPLVKIGLTGLLFFLIVWACDDIFEIDLSGKKVVLIAPGDSIHTEYGTQTFYWGEVKGASSYNLQVVTPSFKHIEQFLADTNVTGPKFTLNLTPGRSYEWRVIAKNGSSKSDSFYIWTLQIDSTTDLRKQKVLLNSPADNMITNIKKIGFNWSLISNTTGYNFQIWKPDLNGSRVMDTTVTSENIATGANLADGTYIWGVKAINNNTSTDLATRKMIIDRTPPKNVPTLTAPANKASFTTWPIDLKWNRSDSDGGSSLYDSVYVAIDTFFTSNVSAYKSTTKTFSFTYNMDTMYFWKVKTIDEAGNSGPESPIQKFTKSK